MKVSLLSLGEQLMTWVLCLQSECLHLLMVANTFTLSLSNMWRLDFLSRLFCRKYCSYAEINRWYLWWCSWMMFHQIYFPQQGYVVYKSLVCDLFYVCCINCHFKILSDIVCTFPVTHFSGCCFLQASLHSVTMFRYFLCPYQLYISLLSEIKSHRKCLSFSGIDW